jgi:hypothetical protein
VGTLTLKSKDTSKLIYHYTSALTAVEFILHDMTLRLGPLNDTNDPAEEGLPTPVIGGGLGDQQERTHRFFELDKLKRGRQLACFSRDRNVPYNGLDPISSRGYGRDRMWAQYADNHRGVCLFFDREVFESEFKKQLQDKGSAMAMPVEYDDYPSVIPSHIHAPIGQVFTEEDCKKRFFTKRKDWESEQEYRFLFVPKDPDTAPRHEYIGIREALVAICVGHRFPGGLRPCIEAICDREKINAFKMKYIGGIPRADLYYPSKAACYPLRVPDL